MSQGIAFFDIEASGLDGYPIEIGWAIPHADSGEITTRSLLIVPPSSWCIDDHWDEAAEALHGITRADLQAHGQSPEQVIRAMNADLSGYVLYADAPAWDIPWFEAIANAAIAAPRFTIASTDALTLIGQAARARGWSPQGFASAISSVDRTHPHRHRAGPDAARLAALWVAALEGREETG